MAGLCLAGAELALLALEPGTPAALPPFWPPAGILVAALILRERRRWAGCLLTGGAAMLVSLALLHGRPLGPSLGVSAGAALDALVIAWLVRRTTDERCALDRLPHAVTLVACAAVVPLADGLLVASLPGSGEPAISAWRAWWLAETIGILVTAPLTMAAVTASWAPAARSWRTLEAIVVIAAGVGAVEVVFRGLPALRVPAIILPFMVWPAFRFGPGVTSAALFAMSSLALWHAARGEGPTVFVSEADVLLRAQAGLAVVAATLLLLASIVAERKRVAHERAALVAELQQALAEIRTLRGLIPICAWCRKVRDDAGFWQEIEKYVDAHTDATFSHGICPACLEREHWRIAAAADDRSSTRPPL